MQALISVVLKKCRNTLIPFVYYNAEEMHTQKSFLVGYERILRFKLGVSARTISTRSLPRSRIATKFKNPQPILVITDQAFMLVLQ